MPIATGPMRRKQASRPYFNAAALEKENRALAALEKENRALKEKLMFDELTGAHSKIALDDELKNRVGLFLRHEEHTESSTETFVVFFMDLDFFKQKNDTEGHDAGDRYLIEFVKEMKQKLRETDIIGRKSGDEFVVIGETHSSTNFIQKMSEHRACLAKKGIHVSMGYAVLDRVFLDTEFPGKPTKDMSTQDVIAKLIKRADQNMFEDKKTKADRYLTATGQAAPKVESDRTTMPLAPSA